MKRLLIAATLALGALAGSEVQARADGKFGVGIGLNLTFSYSCAKSGACPPTYGCGTPMPYPSCQPCYGTYPTPGYGGYPMPGYGGFDGSMAGPVPQVHAAPQYAGGSNPPAASPPPQPVSSTSGYGNYPMFPGNQAIHAAAE
jgi:hypothetical protein